MERARVRSLDEAEVHIDALWRAVQSLQRQVHAHEEDLDTFVRTPAWKRWLFMIDGWNGHRVVDRPRWRPWRKWWTS